MNLLIKLQQHLQAFNSLQDNNLDLIAGLSYYFCTRITEPCIYLAYDFRSQSIMEGNQDTNFRQECEGSPACYSTYDGDHI